MNLQEEKNNYLNLQFFNIKLYELLGLSLIYINGIPLSNTNTVPIVIYLDFIKTLIDEALIRLKNTLIINNGYYYTQLVEHARLYYAGTLWVILMFAFSVTSDVIYDITYNVIYNATYIESILVAEIEEAFNNWQFLLYTKNTKNTNYQHILNILKIDNNHLKF